MSWGDAIYKKVMAKAGNSKPKRPGKQPLFEPAQLLSRTENGFIIDLPIRTVSESNQWEHWGARVKRKNRQKKVISIWWPLLLPRVKVGLPCIVILTRFAQQKLDSGNLEASFKHVQDGVAEMIGIDDGDDRITWKYTQQLGSTIYKVGIEVNWEL